MKKYYNVRDTLADYRFLDEFYEELIKYNGLKKIDVFKELNIPYTSYVRSLEEVKGSNLEKYFNKLRNKFDIKELTNDTINEFNKLFNNILYRMFYFGDKADEFIKKLEEYQEYQNELYPFCKLLMMYVRVMDRNYEYWSNETISISELEPYAKLFSFSPFMEIYQTLKVLTSKNKLVEFETRDGFNSDLKDLIYTAYAYNAYSNRKYELVLYYAGKAKEFLLNSINIKMLFSVNLLYLKALMEIGGYREMVDIAKQQLISIYEYNVQSALKVKTKECLFYAYYALNRYNEFNEIYSINLWYDHIDLIFLLLFSKRDNAKYNEMLEKYNVDKVSFTENQINIIDNVILLIEDVKANNLSKKKELSRLREILRVIG